MREAILSATLLPGTHLAEIDWATRLGLGRFAVREALKRLHGEGLLTRQRGRHQVASLSAEDVREISELRRVLETGALRSLPGPADAVAVREIAAAAADHAELVARGYLAGAREADLRFHRAIVAIGGNRRLIRLYESSNLPLLHVRIGPGAEPLDDFGLAVAEHRAIAEAIGRGAMEEAARALEAHLQRGAAAISEISEKADAKAERSPAAVKNGKKRDRR